MELKDIPTTIDKIEWFEDYGAFADQFISLCNELAYFAGYFSAVSDKISDIELRKEVIEFATLFENADFSLSSFRHRVESAGE